jgi:hypothetical protein
VSEGWCHFFNGLLCLFGEHRPHQMYDYEIITYCGFDPYLKQPVRTCACGKLELERESDE